MQGERKCKFTRNFHIKTGEFCSFFWDDLLSLRRSCDGGEYDLLYDVSAHDAIVGVMMGVECAAVVHHVVVSAVQFGNVG